MNPPPHSADPAAGAPPAPVMSSAGWRLAGWAAILALAAVFALAGTWLLFTTFMAYDDEGYVLLSLRNYAAHGALYDQVYSQYGPFFFAACDALHRALGFAWTNTSARWLTLGLWLGTAALSAAPVWRRTGSTGATAFTFGAVFVYLWVMIHEPSHPGGLVGLLVAAAAWIGVEADPARRPGAAAAIGAIGAALALTKINVGVFLLVSAAIWLAGSAEGSRGQRAAAGLIAAGAAVLPWILMRAMLDQAWVREFAAVSTLASLGVLAVIHAERRPAARAPVLGAAAAGAAAVLLGTVAVSLARGTSLSGLLHGVVLGPLRQPSVYYFAFPWRPGTLAVAVAGLAAAAWAARQPGAPGPRRAAVILRFGAIAALALSLVTILPVSGPALGMSFGVAVAGACAVALRSDPEGREDARARQWLAGVLVLQFLHAYPVAGSQINWATFLWVPLLVLAARDAWLWLAPAAARRRFATAAVALGAFALAGFMGVRLLSTGLSHRRAGEPLGLPGAESIILPDPTAFGTRIVVENARAHADLLATLPGAYSFNLWSDRPTPTLANATHWFSLLSTEQQQAIVDRLRLHPRACLIVQSDVLGYLNAHGFHVRGELAGYLSREFAPAFTVDNFSFWVRRGRSIAPLSTGRVRPSGEGASRFTLDLVLAAPRAEVASIQLSVLREAGTEPRLALTAANATLAVTPLRETGEPLSPARPVAWSTPLPADGVIRLTATFRDDPGPTDHLLAEVKDASGRRVAAALILP